MTITIIVLIIISVAAILLHVWCDVFRSRFHPWLIANATLLGAYRSLLAFFGFPIIILGGLYTYQKLSEQLARPDVALTLSGPKMAAVSVWNVSDAVVRDPKYAVVLFNLDADSNPENPLPIPTAGGDYIRRGERWGPNQMIGQPQVRSQIKAGNRLIGWAYATCPECPKHFYWVFIKHGEFGWYAQLADDQFPDMTKIGRLTKQPEAFLKAFLESVPQDRRISFAENAHSNEDVPEALHK